MYDLIPSLARKVAPHLVHCPSADTEYRNMSAEQLKTCDLVGIWKTRAVGKFSIFNTNDPRKANDKDFLKVLSDADALWFMGGGQEQLSRLYVSNIQPTEFQKFVAEIVRRGGVVGGSSAGCAFMSDIMIGGTLDSDEDLPAKADLSRGLGLLSNVVAEQHFDARRGRMERFSDVMRSQVQLTNMSPRIDAKHLIGLAVEEDTALIVRQNRVRVVGTKKAHLVIRSTQNDSLVWHALEAGDAGFVTSASDGSKHFFYEEWASGN
jgi:cyanophycinase